MFTENSIKLITHVAIKFNGKIYSLPRPNRHHNVIWKIVEETKIKSVDVYGSDQGFLDSTGNYLTRKEALDIALNSGQIRSDRPIYNNELFSENLW